jgi:hypothetical protein
MSIKFKSEVSLDALGNATIDTDKFLVSDSGIVKYRTGTQLLSDLGVPTKTSDLVNDGEDGVNPFITLDNVPPSTNGLPIGGTVGQILTKIDSVDYNATWQENYADWTSVVKHTVKNNGLNGTITKGTAVYVTGSDGTNMLVGKASNTSEATSSKTMGLMQSDITTTGGTQTGFVITEGLLSGLNTAGQTAGVPVWLGVNGTLIYGLTNKPYAPAHLVFIGIVTKVSAGSGEIFVKVQNGFELEEIHDVDIITTTPINGHILGFNGTLWVNKTIAGWLGFTPGTVTNVSAITLGTSGTNLSSTVVNSTTTPVITLNVPTASAINRGALSPTDWTNFNSKQSQLNGNGFIKASGTTISYDNTNYVKSLVNVSPNTTFPSSNVEFSAYTYLLSGNTLTVPSDLNFKIKIRKTGAAQCIIRIKVNTVNNFSTAAILGFFTTGAVNSSIIITRNFSLTGTDIITNSSAVSLLSDELAAANTENSFPANTSSDLYFFVTIDNGSLTNSVILRTVKITN